MMKNVIDRLYRIIGDILYRLYPLHFLMPDKMFLQCDWKKRFGYELDLSAPHTLTEKLQWLKLNDRNPLYTKLVDKYLVKEWISNIIGEEYVIPTIGVFENVNQIDISKLPDKFVIKCTHDSGSVCICKDKGTFPFKDIFNKLTASLKKNYYIEGREWPYKNVQPRIIIEKYIEDKNLNDLRDYKFFCFNGKVKFFKIDFDRQTSHRANYYDVDCNLLPFGECVCPPDFTKDIDMPDNISEIIKLVEIIAMNITSVFERIDFYDVSGKLYFGEITFYPSAGHGKFTPSEWDDILGDMLRLPIDRNNQ